MEIETESMISGSSGCETALPAQQDTYADTKTGITIHDKGLAGEDVLGELHGAFARYLMTSLQAMKRGDLPPNPQLLAVIARFLKDNHVECTKEDMQALGFNPKELPKFEDIELAK